MSIPIFRSTLRLIAIFAAFVPSSSAIATSPVELYAQFEKLVREAVSQQFSSSFAICQPVEKISKSERTAGLGWRMQFHCGTRASAGQSYAATVTAVLSAFSYDHPTISLRRSREFMKDAEKHGGTGMSDTRRTRWVDNDTYTARSKERILQWKSNTRADTHSASVVGEPKKPFHGIPLSSSLSGNKPAAIRVVIKVSYASRDVEQITPTADTSALAIADHVLRGLSNGSESVTATVTLHDANPIFSRTREAMPSDLTTSELIGARQERKGAATDGQSRLIVRAETSSQQPFTFSLSGKMPGKLTPLLDGKTVSAGGKHFAFALYTPPQRFDDARAATMPKSPMVPPKKRLGIVLETRDVEVEVKGADGKVIAKQDIALVRPPVVLVHGLFSDPFETWINTFSDGSSMVVMLEKAGYLPFLVNYQDSNGREVSKGINEDGSGEPAGWTGTVDGPRVSSSFEANRKVVWDSPLDDYTPFAYESGWLKEDAIRSEHQIPKETRIGGISEALTYYRKKLGIAATQATVIGHSMGGLLARVWASPSYNPDYKAARNFNAGDIYRLMTLNTPHHGSELIELKDALKEARIDNEAWLDWARRNLVNTVIGWFLDPEPDAVRDLRPGSAALKRIGPTTVPSYAITTSAGSAQFNSKDYDPYSAYNGLYSAAGMVFFQNRPLLDKLVANRFMRWRNTAAPFKKSTDWRGNAPALNDNDQSLEAYQRAISSNIDHNVYYWAKRREADSREDLRKLLRRVVTVPYGRFDAEMGNQLELALTTMISTGSLLATGTDASRFFDDDKASDVPETFISMLHDLVFHNDAKSDGAVRVESQRGGLAATENVESVLHSYAAWHYEVQRKAIFALKWQPEIFDSNGFPEAGQLTERYLPSDVHQKARTEGSRAIAWSGMVPSHAEQYLRVADEEDTMVLVRPVNPSSTPLLANNAAAKGMNIKGKSSNWGPQVGYIPVDQRYSKLWQMFKDPSVRDNKIGEYNAEVCKSLTTAHPELPDKKFAEARPLQVATSDKGACLVLTDPEEPDAEQSIALKCGDGYFDWRNADKDSKAVFDPWAPLKAANIDAAKASRMDQNPLGVLADGTQESLPYLTADYDLLAIGFRRDDGFHGPPPEVVKAEFDELRGIISAKQLKLVEKINEAVIEKTGYASGWVTHHGPENQYPKSPYIDYPVLVFDPGSKERGDGSAYLIRQGPPGFRDIHLKRFFSEQAAKKINLWPNPKSKGWQWEKRRKFDLVRGYDPRDADDLLIYVEEAPEPDKLRPPPKNEKEISKVPPVQVDCATKTRVVQQQDDDRGGNKEAGGAASFAGVAEQEAQQADDGAVEKKLLEPGQPARTDDAAVEAKADESREQNQARPSSPSATEQAFWDDVKDSKSADELHVYLDTFPNGFYAALARVRLKRLSAQQAPSNGGAEREAPSDESQAKTQRPSKSVNVAALDRSYEQFRGNVFAGAPDSVGGYLLGGELSEGGKTTRKAMLISLDQSGDLKWSRPLSGTKAGAIDRIYPMSDNGILVLGSTKLAEKTHDAWVKLIGRDGVVRWTHRVGEYDASISNSSYVPSTDDLIWLIAKAASPDEGGGIRLLKLDRSGNLIQDSRLIGAGGEHTVGAVLLDNSAYLLTGGSAGNKFTTWLTRLDGRGRMEWTRRIGSAEKSIDTWHMEKTADGHLLLAGLVEYNNNALAQNIWLAKLSPKAELLWEREINIEHHDIANAVVEMEKGIILVSAEVRARHEPASRIWIGAFDADGKGLGQIPIEVGRNTFISGAIIPTSERALMIAGTKQLTEAVRSPWLAVIPNAVDRISEPSHDTTANDPPRHLCDELASDPFDPEAKGPGVEWLKIDNLRAREACQAALTEHPGTLRFIYQVGRAYDEEGSYEEARRHYEAAALKGYIAAMSALGTHYYRGRGTSKDYEKALYWFRRGAEADHPPAQRGLALLYLLGKGIAQNYGEAQRLLRAAAKRNYSPSMHDLGTMYSRGDGVSKNFSEAVHWWRKAAELGNRYSMYSLSRMYSKGQGAEKNEKSAAAWMVKAAEAGIPEAMLEMALRYHRGRGVSKDNTEALRWLRQSAKVGNAEAMAILGTAYSDGQLGLARDDTLALYWLKEAAERGHAGAMNNIGVMLASGRGEEKDIEKASSWYQRSAEGGNWNGMYNWSLALAHQSAAEDAATWMVRAIKSGKLGIREKIYKNAARWPRPFIAALQRLLVEEGTYEGDVDGKFGPATMEAVNQLTRSIDRIPSPHTQGATSVDAVVTATATVDAYYQKSPLWRLLKREYPEWYGARMKEAALLSSGATPTRDTTQKLVEALVQLRRSHADNALKADAARLKSIAVAFLQNLRALSKAGAETCYGFLSQGESSPKTVDLFHRPASSPALEGQAIRIFEAIAEGQSSPAHHDLPKKGDYDMLSAELRKLGWSNSDLKLFANPNLLANVRPKRMCTMMRDWIKAHISILDAAVQERLLFQTLRPVVAG